MQYTEVRSHNRGAIGTDALEQAKCERGRKGSDFRAKKPARLGGTSRASSSQRRRSSSATLADMSRDQPSPALKLTTRTGSENCPPTRSWITFSKPCASPSLSHQARAHRQ